MTSHFNWILPEGIDTPGPGRSQQRERLRRSLLDMYKSWGYLQVSPPLMEYAEYFRSAEDFTRNQRLFFLTDPLTGRQLALRADATSQIARLRASVLADSPDPVRLCYCLPTVHRHPESLGVPRFFYQVGLELFGAAGMDADAEVLELMCRSMQQAGVEAPVVSLGHTGFFSSLMDAAEVSEEDRRRLQELLQRRSLPELRVEAEQLRLSERHTRLLCTLGAAHGDIADLQAALEPFAEIPASAEAAEQLCALAGCVPKLPRPMRVQFDLAEAHGQLYHEGLVFACFTPEHGSAVARGGRYPAPDGSFAVGFSSNLWLLASLGLCNGDEPMRVLAPPYDIGKPPAEGLQQAIDRLRAEGVCVQRALGQQGEDDCTHRLESDGTRWQPVAVKPSK